MGLSFDELFPGRFVKSGQFKGRDVTLTIKAIRLEALPSEKGGEKVKPILTFEKTPLELVLNRTNGESIKAMFGRETDAWLGKRVTFWPAPFTDPFTGEVGTAIRVRGSPDIAAPVSFELRLARKKATTVRLLKTAGQAKGKVATAPTTPPAPQPARGEPPPPDDAEQWPPPEPEGIPDNL